MFEDMIKELDEKVEFLMEKNNKYRMEIALLRDLLDEAGDENQQLRDLLDKSGGNNCAQPQSSALSEKLKPLLESAQSVLEHIKNVGREA